MSTRSTAPSKACSTLVSDRAATVFGIALLASGFASSSVGTMAGQVVMQGFIRRRIPIFVRRAITLTPALVVLAIGVDPTDALVGSQVVLSFGIPFALVPLLMIASKREVMGDLVNPALAERARRRPRQPDHRPQRLPPLAGLLRLMERRGEFGSPPACGRAGGGLGAGDECRGDQRRARAGAADDGAARARQPRPARTGGGPAGAELAAALRVDPDRLRRDRPRADRAGARFPRALDDALDAGSGSTSGRSRRGWAGARRSPTGSPGSRDCRCQAGCCDR